MSITKKQVLKTVLLPGIFPRLKDLFGSGFSTLAYMIALVYNTVRILPNNHPYLRAEMIGQYSIRQVIAEASNHITPNRKNIDQIIIFFSIIAALIIMLIQFILLIVAMLIPKAQAAVTMPTTIKEFFVTSNPEEDLAYRLLDLVFGIPDFFGSKDMSTTSLHKGLHALFEFYSYGMIIVGAMIIVYFVIAVVAETAQSGTPFGRRFNKAWAPVRVVLFFGLLIPISNGLNGGQYVTLTAAKLGSGLASTGWLKFNETITEANSTLTGKKEQNVATPKYSDLGHIPAFMLITKTCQISYNKIYNEDYFPDSWNPKGADTGVQAWAVYKTVTSTGDGKTTTTHSAKRIEGAKFQDLSHGSKGSNLAIVFGVKDDKLYTKNNANVEPICGQITLEVTDVSEPGSAVIHQAYFQLIQDMWEGKREIGKYAENYTKRALNIKGDRDPKAQLPDEEYIKDWNKYLKEYMEGKDDEGYIAKAVKEQIEKGDWETAQQMKDYGWAGAGIWYNKIAQQNGALVSSLRLTPSTTLYPRVMEQVKSQQLRENKNTDFDDVFRPTFAGGASKPSYKFIGEDQIASTLNLVFQYWQLNEYKKDIRTTGNKIIDTINLILGTSGLFEMCENTNIHPLAQLSTVGKSMLDSSIRALGLSGAFGFASIFAGELGVAASAASSFFSTIAMVGLLVGFILFYVLPFMPFIYFFFAVGGWVKSIFEAMVAMPLWALAHLRIDGEGIPGDAAIGGYFLIFEIFIRPILIVVGLLAAISIFAGMVKILNEIFYLVTSNLSGHDPKSSSTDCFKAPAGADAATKANAVAQEAESKDAFRGPIDEFFFTILYTIIVYMIGTSCFKLIDTIPNTLLTRWANVEVPSFGDDAGDASEGLMTYITLAGSQFGQQIGGSISQMGGGAKESITQFKNSFGS